MNFFYNNLGTRVVITYFCFVLIGLINDYKNHKKNIYSRNNNICLEGFWDGFYDHCYF